MDRSMGVWGIFLPWLCQLITGLILFVGLTWFQVFTDKPLHRAALAFSAYGIHWFAIGWNRFQGNDPRPDAGMSVGFLIISALGIFVFFRAGAWPVGLLFCGLFAVCVGELLESVGRVAGERLLGLAHLVTGIWPMYLTVATTLNIVSGFTLPGG